MIFAKSESEINSAPRFVITFLSLCLTKTAFLVFNVCCTCTVLFVGMTKLYVCRVVYVPFIGRYSHSSHLI